MKTPMIGLSIIVVWIEGQQAVWLQLSSGSV
jgi:hypothetical protein